MDKLQPIGNTRAILWVLLGTALFTIVYASGKFADGTASSIQVVFLRYVSGFITLLAIVAAFGDKISVYRSKRAHIHLFRAVLGCYGGVAIIYASANMPLLDATAISLLYVIFIVTLGIVLLKERVGRLHWIALVLSSLGAAIVMIARGAFQTFDAMYLFPALVALGGAFLIALEAILIRTLSQSEKTLTVLLYINYFGILLLVAPAYSTWQTIAFRDAALIVLLGPLAISAQYCIIKGYRTAEVSVLGPIDYTWLVFAGVLGFAAFGEVPTLGVLLGVGLIATGGVMLALVKRQQRDAA